MTTYAQTDEGILARALAERAEHGIPETVDLWPLVQQRVALRTPQTTRSAVCWRGVWRHPATVVMLLATVAVAGRVTSGASAQVQLLVGHVVAAASSVVGVSLSSDGQTVGVTPSPSFAVAEVGYLPTGFTSSGVASIPAAPQSATEPGSPAAILSDARTQQHADAAVHRLAATGRAAIWMQFVAPSPGTAYVEISEQPATLSSTQHVGDTLLIDGDAATIEQTGNVITLTLVRSTTAVTIQANIDRAEVIKIARGLTWLPAKGTR